MAQTHRLAARIAFEQHAPATSVALGVMDRLFWPVEVWERLRDLGADTINRAAEVTAAAPHIHFLKSWWRCSQYGLPPDEFHSLEMFRPEIFRHFGDFIFMRHSNRIYAALHDLCDEDELTTAGDKALFSEFCRAHRVPAALNLATVSANRFVAIEPVEGAAWRTDLVIKPQNGSNGMGLSLWRWLGEGQYASEAGKPLSTEDLVHWAIRASQHVPLVVQPRLRNCPQSSKFSGGGLSTVRVVTGRYPKGEPLLLAAAIKMPVGGSQADNFIQGNAISQIDRESGTMTPGRLYHRKYQPIEVHPDTGARFAGVQTPQWDAIVDLARRAHRHFPTLPIMAFDIAPCEGGPAIVEANTRGDFAMVQMPGGPPAGLTEYPKLIMAHEPLFRRGVLAAWNTDWR
jgi:hypothetical protein